MLSIFLALLIFLLGCTAPHDNPLDPDSDRYVAPLPTPYVPDFSARVWSEHVSYVFPSTDLYQIRVSFTNPDTTFRLDSVWVVYDGLTPRTLGPGPAEWSTNFAASFFGCGSLMECAMGQPFDFVARDWRSETHHAGPLYVFRVIAGTPMTSEPDSDDVVEPVVLLQWPQFSANYVFGVRATVTKLLSPFTWESPLLPKQQLLVLSDSLADGNYYWTLTVEDAFGNTSRSKEAYFSVSAGAPL